MKRQIAIQLLCMVLFVGCFRSDDVHLFSTAPETVHNVHEIHIPKHEMKRVLNLQPIVMGKVEEKAFEGMNLGIVVPHHLLAADWIGEVFEQIKAFDPEVVILMAPNHKEEAIAQIITHHEPIMVMKQNFEMDSSVNALIKKGIAVAHDETFDDEHGIYNLIPFIEFQQWETKLIPLVLARDTGLSELENLRLELEQNVAQKRTLWVASIDFSHYLPAAAASINDMETQKWIEERDFSSIMVSTDTHLDAPAVLTLWLNKFENVNLLWHSNSAEIVNGGHMVGGTSYMIYYGY